MTVSALSAEQLSLYNGALDILGEEPLAEDEDRNPRRVLDRVWTRGAVNFCLSSGDWTFATRSLQLEYEPSIDPGLGFRYAFVKPDDCVRVIAVASDGYFVDTLDQGRCVNEKNYFYCDESRIFIRYVSNANDFGNDIGQWPRPFSAWVELYLAYNGCNVITGKEPDEKMERKYQSMLNGAKSKDAFNNGAKPQRMSKWVGARLGRRGHAGNISEITE